MSGRSTLLLAFECYNSMVECFDNYTGSNWSGSRKGKVKHPIWLTWNLYKIQGVSYHLKSTTPFCFPNQICGALNVGSEVRDGVIGWGATPTMYEQASSYYTGSLQNARHFSCHIPSSLHLIMPFLVSLTYRHATYYKNIPDLIIHSSESHSSVLYPAECEVKH